MFNEEAKWDWKEASDENQFSITFEDETQQSLEQPVTPPTP